MKRIAIISLFAALYICSFAQHSPMAKAATKYAELIYSLSQLYVDSIDPARLTEVAIESVLKQLDPHSVYIPAADVARANEGLQGNFEGIGITYQMINDTLTVNQTIAGCPAEKVGLLPGDKVTHVDGVNIAGVKYKLNDIPKLIRGKKGTTVKLTAVRNNRRAPIHFKIVRDKIPINSVDAAFYASPGIGYIKVNSFSATTTKEMDDALARLKNEGDLKALVIDLQSNGGGIMQASIDMVSRFIPKGRMVVYSEGLHQHRIEGRATNIEKLTDLPLAVLINEHSASASEITAGALQDWDRALIVGRRSFGKGLVQRPTPMSDGSELRITIARYYTPSGRNIQKPYNQGAEKYLRDIEERYKRGEFIHPDSISFPDSLKYETLVNHRTVYGGGGIFPDIFVPLDTSHATPYYNKLFNSGVFHKFLNSYIDQHRAQLQRNYPTFNNFNADFEADAQILNALIDAATAESIDFVQSEFEAAREVLKRQIKANVAQSLYGTEYFYRVIYPINDALTAAVESLKNDLK